MLPIRFLSPLLIAVSAFHPVAAMANPPVDACALDRPAEEGEALLDLPFRTVDGRIYLDAQVNGQGPYTFAIDTGASGVGRADASLVAELSLPSTGASETSDGVTTSAVDTVRIASLVLGGLERSDVTVITRDYRSRVSEEAAFAGILGREFFADGLLVIDFPARRIAFYRNRELPAGKAGAMSYDRAFRIPVSIGELETTANLDTGANITLVIPDTLVDELEDTVLQAGEDSSLMNTRLASANTRLSGPLRFGGASLTDIPTRVVEGYPEVLIGAHALQDQTVLIDQRHQTLAICPAE